MSIDSSSLLEAEREVERVDAYGTGGCEDGNG